MAADSAAFRFSENVLGADEAQYADRRNGVYRRVARAGIFRIELHRRDVKRIKINRFALTFSLEDIIIL